MGAVVAVLVVGLVSAPTSQAGDLSGVISECAACHGPEGVGRDVEIPNLAGQHDRYLYTQLQNFRSGKRPHKEMRYMSRQLSDEEMQAIAQFYSQMTRCP